MNEVDPPGAGATRSLRDAYLREFRYVYQTVRRLGVRPSDLEDVVHDVFVAASRCWENYDPSRPLRPWLFGVAFRIVSAHRRRHAYRYEIIDGREVESADEEPNPEAKLEGEERRRIVARALDALEEERRAVFVLHEIDGVAIPEVAACLEIPLGTAYTRLRLAREDFNAAVKKLQQRRVQPPSTSGSKSLRGAP